MPTNLTVNGVQYAYPNTGDQQWGNAATNWAIAVTNGMLQKAGGNFTLTADVNFGTNFGVFSKYLTSVTANPAAAGVIRLANTDTVNFRNAANSGDDTLGANSSDRLQWNSVNVPTISSTDTLTNKSLSDTTTLVVNATDATKQWGWDLSAQTTGTKTTLKPSSTANRTLTLPDATDQVVCRATTDTLTNKTIAAGSNTVSGLANSNLSGSAAITNANLATMAANTIKANNTGGSATPSDITVAQLTAMLSVPTVQKFTSGSGTYTTPANVRYIRVRMVGGGGGGAGSGTTSGTAATAGGNTTFGTSLLVANGGGAGVTTSGTPGAGGTASLGTGPIGVAFQGATGQGNQDITNTTCQLIGGMGGGSPFGGAGAGGQYISAGGNAVANTGSGGGGAGCNNVSGSWTGGGGAAGGFVDAIITNPGATYSYAVGSGGSAGTLGTSGFNGGAGAAGIIVVEEFYQ